MKNYLIFFIKRPHANYLIIRGRGRYLGIIAEARANVFDLELALYVAALVHEVESAKSLHGHEALAALRGIVMRELGALLGEGLVAREMLAINESNAVVGGDAEAFVGASQREKGADRALTLGERESPLVIGRGEVARLELGRVRVQYEAAGKHESEELRLLAVVCKEKTKELRHE